MTMICKNCGAEIIELNFTEQQKSEITKIVKTESKLACVKKMMEEYSLNHYVAKSITTHLNNYRTCHKCNFEELVGENIECPKCKSFNYNLKPV
jgi:hypothetical protein